MQVAAIPYGSGKLEACEQDDLWTVRLANLEVRARYLDLALAELLGNAPEAHRAAARLLAELADVVEQQEAAYPHLAPVQPREATQRSASRGVGKAAAARTWCLRVRGRCEHSLHADDLAELAPLDVS